MTDLTQQLDKLIQQAALDGALTKDAVELFHDLVKENDGLRASLKESEKNLEQSVKTRDILRSERDQARQDRDMLAKFHKDVEDREKKMTQIEVSLEYEQKRVVDHKHMMETIFKPHTVRESIYKSRQEKNEYGSLETMNDNEDKTIDHE